MNAQHLTTQRLQVPGFQRRTFRAITVTALYDGTVAIDPEAFAGVTAEERAGFLARQLHPTEGKIDTSVNAFIVDTGSRVLLIDAGSGNTFGPTMGRLAESLVASGYRPEDIDTVLITHLHPDHVGGVSTDEGAMAFPNAMLWAPKADADFWLVEATREKIPEVQGWFIDVASEAVAPYQAEGRFETFVDGDTLVDGLVQVVGLPGHTPGHSGFRIITDGVTILFWGDITHLPAVQLAQPGATIDLDIIPELAVSSRERALAEAVETGIWIGAAHLPFPGFGRVRKDIDGHTWIAAEYAALPPVAA